MAKHLLVPALLLAHTLSAQVCEHQIDGGGANIPIPAGGGAGVTTMVTFDGEDSVACDKGCTYQWDVTAVFTYDPLPLPDPRDVQVCASGGGAFTCSGAVLTLGPGGPPYVYTFTSMVTGFTVPCPGAFNLTLQWNPGLGFIPVVELSMQCGPCIG